MRNKIQLFLFTCIFLILGILVIQLYWLNQYYELSKKDFEREVNLSFEDALKKEFSIRCDSVELLITKQLLDSNEFRITSKFDTTENRYEYKIADAKKNKDILHFSTFEFNAPLVEGDTAFKRKIASEYAKRIKDEDLVNHFVFYRSQHLGKFVSDKTKEFAFDTARLRPVLVTYLAKRNIFTPFQFYLTYKDSTANFSNFPDSVKKKYPVITKAALTYKWWVKDEQFIRTMFANPSKYIISKLKWMIAASIALVLLVGCCVYFLFKAWLKEKKLSVIKDDFINNITHELKTPVATIAAAIEALSDFDAMEDKEKANRYLKHSSNELIKLNELINQVLNISLYENQKLNINYENIIVCNELKEITDTLQLATPHKIINVEFEGCNDNAIIKADRYCFIQTVSNVIQNAIKYADDKVDISLRCKNLDTIFEIAISDNGWGIDASDLPYVFGKFYRGIRKDHLVKGHGLGLYHVKQIMEMHNGSIVITSKKEKGTTVYLRWPI